MSGFGYTSTKNHKCAAVRCRARINVAFLMCGPHWKMVPGEIQTSVYRYWRRGLKLADQFEEYRVAVRRAIEAVMEKEKSC